jgi:hypothetical protein
LQFGGFISRTYPPPLLLSTKQQQNTPAPPQTLSSGESLQEMLSEQIKGEYFTINLYSHPLYLYHSTRHRSATNNTAAALTLTTPLPFDWIDTAGNDVVTDKR